MDARLKKKKQEKNVNVRKDIIVVNMVEHQRESCCGQRVGLREGKVTC
jgi:hypothetical protein